MSVIVCAKCDSWTVSKFIMKRTASLNAKLYTELMGRESQPDFPLILDDICRVLITGHKSRFLKPK